MINRFNIRTAVSHSGFVSLFAGDGAQVLLSIRPHCWPQERAAPRAGKSGSKSGERVRQYQPAAGSDEERGVPLLQVSSQTRQRHYNFNRRCRIYSGFQFLLAHLVPPFQHVENKMWHQSAIFENSWPPFCQIRIIFTHLKLRISSARHNFKWVKIQIE